MTAPETPYGLYYIDRDYLSAIHEADSKTPDCTYEDSGRARKFYCGPVTKEEGVDYYVPVSHQVKNMQLSKYETYGISIMNTEGEKKGCLDFRFMIPCVDTQFLSKIEKNDMSEYGKSQYDFCMNNERIIKKEAHATYNNIISKDYGFLNKTAVCSEAVIDAAWQYMDEIEARKEKAAMRNAAANDLGKKDEGVQVNEQPANTKY